MAALLVDKRRWEVKDGTTKKQIQVVVGAGLKLETSSLWVQINVSTTRPFIASFYLHRPAISDYY